MATTTPRPLAGVRPLITTAEVCDFAPGEGAADAAGDVGPGRRPRRRPHGARRGGPDRAPVLRPQRGRLRVDGGARVVVPRELRRTPSAGARRAAAARLPRARHLRHRVPQRRGARAPREHVPRGVVRRHRARARARTRSRSASTRRSQHARARDPEQWSSTPAERVWMRKAQYGFGWDWGPRLPTIGIWRPVELRRERVATLTRVNFSTLAIGREALVAVDVEAERFAGDGRLVASIELRPPGGGEPARATRDAARRRAATAYLALERPAAVVDARPRRAGAARPARDAEQRRRGRRRARAPRRGAHARARPAARPRRARARASSASCSTASASSPAARTGSRPTRSSARSSRRATSG